MPARSGSAITPPAISCAKRRRGSFHRRHEIRLRRLGCQRNLGDLRQRHQIGVEDLGLRWLNSDSFNLHHLRLNV